MRLAVVMSHADRRMTGARRELHWLAAMRGLGAQARLFRMHAGPPEEEWYLDGRVPALFLPADDQTLPARQRASTALIRAIADFRPTLILFKGLGYRVNQSVVGSLWSCPFGFIAGGNTEDPLLNRASLVLAEHDGQLAGDFAALHAAGRSMILPKYFDADLAWPAPPEERRRYDIVNVGGFQDGRKNQVALLPLARRRWVLFVGGGEMLARAQEGAPARARFVGSRPQDAVYDYLRQARLMVHPSTYEGLPRAAVEAMACGLPVVAYRHVITGGIRHGETGLLVTPETMQEEVEALLSDPDRLAAMGAAAREDALANHGPAALVRAAATFLDLTSGLGLD